MVNQADRTAVTIENTNTLHAVASSLMRLRVEQQ